MKIPANVMQTPALLKRVARDNIREWCVERKISGEFIFDEHQVLGNYYVLYDHHKSKLIIQAMALLQFPDAIAFPSEEAARQCINDCHVEWMVLLGLKTTPIGTP